MTDRQGAEVVRRLYSALSRGDVAAARACCTPDVRIWHNFDCKAQSLDEIAASWEGFIAGFPERYIADVRCMEVADGVVQRHLQVMRDRNGIQRTWPICIVVTVRNGLIARLDEYMDRAGSLAGNVTTTPGFD